LATETITIPLTNGKVKGTDFVSNKEDTQYVTFEDGGNLTNVKIEKFGKGTPTEAGDGPGGDDQFHIDLSGFNDDFSMTVMSFDSGDTFYFTKALSWSNVGTVWTIDYIGSDNQPHTVSIDLDSTNGTGVASIVVTCFADGTMIRTPAGEVPVEDICAGDLVTCGDGVARPVRWIASRRVDAADMAQHPDFRPIVIRKGAFGDAVPARDLRVSPQHRILIDDWRAEMLFGAPEVLVPAVMLLNDRDILRDSGAEAVTYYHLMFDAHQTVWSDGMQTESFFPGDIATTQGLEDPTRDELFALFPELKLDLTLYGETCHPVLKAHEVQAMFGR
jgi:hypothetical protein